MAMVMVAPGSAVPVNVGVCVVTDSLTSGDVMATADGVALPLDSGVGVRVTLRSPVPVGVGVAVTSPPPPVPPVIVTVVGVVMAYICLVAGLSDADSPHLALVQFDSAGPILTVGGGIALVQLVNGQILDPRLTGRSLNLSPLAIILSLTLWGMLWGIAGMFLCVPITVVAMIVLSHFEATRPVAVMLSQEGRIRTE